MSPLPLRGDFVADKPVGRVASVRCEHIETKHVLDKFVTEVAFVTGGLDTGRRNPPLLNHRGTAWKTFSKSNNSLPALRIPLM